MRENPVPATPIRGTMAAIRARHGFMPHGFMRHGFSPPGILRRGLVSGVVVAFFALCLVVGANQAQSAPRAELWPRWQAHDPQSALTPDHGPWQMFLDRYRVAGADGVARVRYGAVTGEDHRRLAAYVDDLAAMPVSRMSRPHQKAYWINLYNALTVRVVLDHFPVASIRDIAISPGWFTRGPWGARLVTIEDEALSLDDIEHRILRPIWRDSRIHYAVNCASIGCPDLHPEAFHGERLEAQLEAAARSFVTHPRALTLEGGQIVASRIYRWFEEDFAAEGGIIPHLLRYRTDTVAERLRGGAGIDRHAYDWSLNVAP